MILVNDPGEDANHAFEDRGEREAGPPGPRWLNAALDLDKVAAEGTTFSDYYGEASCTASRAAFITGELPIRTGLTTVG